MISKTKHWVLEWKCCVKVFSHLQLKNCNQLNAPHLTLPFRASGDATLHERHERLDCSGLVNEDQLSADPQI